HSFRFASKLRPPSSSTIFPYTTLFRSDQACFSESGLQSLLEKLNVNLLADLGYHDFHLVTPLSHMPADWRAIQAGMRSVVENIKDRKSTRLNSSHVKISYAVFCLKKKN